MDEDRTHIIIFVSQFINLYEFSCSKYVFHNIQTKKLKHVCVFIAID